MDTLQSKLQTQIGAGDDGRVSELSDQDFEAGKQKNAINKAVVQSSLIHPDDAAAAANNAEHQRTLWQNLKLYPYAVGWSILLSTTVIMEGFDIQLVTSLLAVPSFRRTFGEQLSDGTYQITAAWQTGLTNGAVVGEILGLGLTGVIADRFGYKKSMIGTLALTVAFIFIPFFSTSIIQLLVGLILLGILWGVFQIITTTYAAEVCPTGLRPYLTTYVNLCWVFGQLLASGVLRGVQSRSDEWAYRIPYALQWIWPIPLIVGILFAPESPWWLVRKERYTEARQVLTRLTSSTSSVNFSLDDTLSMMRQTNEAEKAINEGTSYIDCFKGVELRRTEIVCTVWLIQTVAGATFMGYATYFYEQAGLATSNAFSLDIGRSALGAVGTILSWYLMVCFGRRTLYLLELAMLGTLFLTIGLCGIAPRSNTASQWAIGSLLIVFTFVYDCTIGPVCYCLVAEIASTRLRQKMAALARSSYNIGSIVCNILVTRQLNPGAWNWGPKAGFFWAGSCLTCFLWSFFRLPEPKDRTFAELDILFEQRVPARDFSKAVVSNFETASPHDNKIGTSGIKEPVDHVEKAND